MSQVYVTIKLMPKSLDINLEDIKKEVENVIIKNQGRLIEAKEESVAFGLKALVVQFSINENQDLESIEKELQTKESVNSVSIIEMSRAL